MTDATVTLSMSATDTPNGGTVVVYESTASTDPARVPRSMPASIPADQAYYWSHVWQEDVREAMAALEAGEYEQFDSDDPNDVVRWFLSDH